MRLPHLLPFEDGQIVFVTACTAGRRPVLNNNHALNILRAVWERSAADDGWYVGRFVLMPDHVHLFACPYREAKPLRDWIKMWKSISARRITSELQIDGPIWQPGYFDRFLRSAENYGEKWDYVLANPVRAGLVRGANDWPWQGVVHDLEMRRIPKPGG